MPFDSKTGKQAARKQKRGEAKATKAIKELLSPHAAKVSLQLVTAAHAGEPWAVKLFMEYLYGKPKQTIEMGTVGDIDINVTFTNGGKN